MSDDKLLTISQMCEAFGVTPRTLRFYEARELISPIRRGQHRLYDRRDRARLKLILRGKRFGFSLDEMGRLLDLYQPGTDNAHQLRATLDLARGRLAEMRNEHADLLDAIKDLESQIALTRALLPGKHHSAPDQSSKDAT